MQTVGVQEGQDEVDNENTEDSNPEYDSESDDDENQVYPTVDGCTAFDVTRRYITVGEKWLATILRRALRIRWTAQRARRASIVKAADN
ncbi:hypothetical protein MCOR25_010616 [Pyricularia grisea]|nr:hypothetical protein MCOR25_010616 [Pyricularia grisea]